MMRALTPLVEPLSIDEAFLDLTGTKRLHHASPAETLARFAATVEREIGITVSVDLSHNKFLAKMESDMDKPRGFSIIGRAETASLLASLLVSKIWGVGKSLEGKLAADGITAIAQLQATDETDLAKYYGTIGLRLAYLSRGRDDRKVSPDNEAKNVSAETTFNTDIRDADELIRVLRRLSEKISFRLKKAGIAGRTVTLKLKTPDFHIHTRSRQLADPTQLADRIFRTGREVLLGETNGRRFRLLGIGVSDLCDAAFADPNDLVDEASTRAAKAEHAVDTLREKFGKDAVELGFVWGGKRS